MRQVNWKLVPLNEVCDSIVDCVNKTAPIVDYVTPYKMLRTTNIKKGVVDTNSVRYVTEETFQKWTRRAVPQHEDVILTREAPLGDVGMLTSSDQKVFLGQRLMQYRADKQKLDPYFLLYSLQGPSLQGQLKAAGSGSTVEHIRVGDAEKLEIALPSIDEQKQIGSLLYNYDKLIENNNRRIAILEDMAESLYREWFVKFRYPGHQNQTLVDSPLGPIPEGWVTKTLGDVLELAYGKALKKADRKGGPVSVYGSGGQVGNHEKSLIQGPCIIVGRKGNVGKTFWVDENCWPIDTVFYVVSDYSKHYLYFNLLNQKFYNSDAAVPGLNRESAYSNTILIPPGELLGWFDSFVGRVFAKRKILLMSVANLKSQRDMLLPKLISGKIDLNKAD